VGTDPRPKGWQDLDVPNDSARNLADFDRYVEEHGIPEEDYPAAFALWIAQHMDGRVPRFERLSGSHRRTAS
jgi:hypothetical protein